MIIASIMDGVSIALYAKFGASYKIHGDKAVVQSLDAPCFFINVIDTSREATSPYRYILRASFDVAFFPEEQGDYSELYEIGDQMFDALETVTLTNADKIRGDAISYDVVDGVLHFRITYIVPLQKTPTEDMMETVQAEVSLDTDTMGELN